MESFLYFAQGDGANASSEAVMYPVSSFRGIDVGNGDMTLFFSPLAITDVAAADVCDKVVLSVANGNQKAVMKAIAEKINSAPLGPAFIVIADEDNGVYCHPKITQVETTLAA